MSPDGFIRNALKSRIAQWAIAVQLRDGKIKNPVHLALGHEISTNYYLSTFKELPRFFLPHRNIHFNLGLALRGNFEITTILEEVIGQSSGVAGGQLGSMNLAAPSIGSDYSSSILANALGVAAGAAFGYQRSRPNIRATVVLGDGAIEEGRFWEVLTLVKGHALPLDIIVENNGWSMQSSISQRRHEIDLVHMGQALQITAGSYDFRSPEIIDTLALDAGWDGIGPRLLEFKINTLGGVEVEDGPGSRYINYHSGKILADDRYADSAIGLGLSEADPLTDVLCEKYLGLENARSMFEKISAHCHTFNR